MYLVAMAFYAIYALDDMTIPNPFSPNTPARSAEVNENNDSTKIAFNRLNDTLANDFTRNIYFESGDTTIKTIYVDTVVALVCSVNVRGYMADLTAGTVNIDGGTIDGVTIGGSTEGAGYFDTLHSVKGITGTALNTGQGLNELYPMDQAVLTTSDVTFDSAYAGKVVTPSAVITTLNANGGTIDNTIIGGSGTAAISGTTGSFSGALTGTTLNTGQGANELYDMNQNVLTTSDVTFNNGTFNDKVLIDTLSSNSVINLLKVKNNYTAGSGTGDDAGCSIEMYNGIAEATEPARRGVIEYYSKGFFDNPDNTFLHLNNYKGSKDEGLTITYKAVGIGTSTPNALLTIDSSFTTKEVSAFSTPSSGYGKWYAKTDGLPYFKNDAGTEYGLAAGSEGSFTGTLTGCTTSPTVTVYYVVSGDLVTMTIGDITGTSNTSAMSITGMPSGIWPNSDQAISVSIFNGGSLQSDARVCLVKTTGVIEVQGTITASSTKGFKSSSSAYRTNN